MSGTQPKKEYSTEQLLQIYKRYAEKKGWNAKPKHVAECVALWQASSLGAVGLAIKYFESGSDNAEFVPIRPQRWTGSQIMIQKDGEIFSVPKDQNERHYSGIWHFWSYIAGTDYPNADGIVRATILEQLPTGEKLYLQAEPTNKHDPYAVGVFTKQRQHVGYVPSQLAKIAVTDGMLKMRGWIILDKIWRDFGLLFVFADDAISLPSVGKYISLVWNWKNPGLVCSAIAKV